MTYLLDISVLLAWLWEKHEHHRRVLNWEAGKSIAICPLTELGFLRISTSPVFGATMQQAREMLAALLPETTIMKPKILAIARQEVETHFAKNSRQDLKVVAPPLRMTVCLDTNVFLQIFGRSQPYHQILRTLLDGRLTLEEIQLVKGGGK